VSAADVAVRLAERGLGVWAHDNWYSLGLREKLPYPQDAVRVGFIHYNTVDEVDRFVAELAAL
jgi:selenocysteine lyase/cysteine desulfurase